MLCFFRCAKSTRYIGKPVLKSAVISLPLFVELNIGEMMVQVEAIQQLPTLNAFSIESETKKQLKIRSEINGPWKWNASRSYHTFTTS